MANPITHKNPISHKPLRKFISLKQEQYLKEFVHLVDKHVPMSMLGTAGTEFSKMNKIALHILDKHAYFHHSADRLNRIEKLYRVLKDDSVIHSGIIQRNKYLEKLLTKIESELLK